MLARSSPNNDVCPAYHTQETDDDGVKQRAAINASTSSWLEKARPSALHLPAGLKLAAAAAAGTARSPKSAPPALLSGEQSPPPVPFENEEGRVVGHIVRLGPKFGFMQAPSQHIFFHASELLPSDAGRARVGSRCTFHVGADAFSGGSKSKATRVRLAPAEVGTLCCSPSAAAAASTAEAAAAPLCVGVVTRVLTVAEADLRQAPNKKPQSGGGGGEAGYALLKFADGRRVAIALDGGAGSSIGVFGGQSGCSGGGSCNDRGIRVCEGCAGCTTQDALAGVSSAISTAPLARLRSALRVGNVVALSPDAEPCGEDHEAAAADKLWAWCVDGKAERFDRGTVHVVAASTAPTEAGCEDGASRGRGRRRSEPVLRRSPGLGAQQRSPPQQSRNHPEPGRSSASRSWRRRAGSDPGPEPPSSPLPLSLPPPAQPNGTSDGSPPYRWADGPDGTGGFHRTGFHRRNRD